MEILLKMIPVSEKLPEDGQHVLIDNGSEFTAATFDKRLGQFQRLSNTIPGDRCLTYFYSGVKSWCPMPKSEETSGFKAEQEPPPQHPLYGTFSNGEARGEDGWPTAESFSSIGL